MKHLITGGSGFLGNLIARRIAARGEEVTVLDLWQDASQPKEIQFIHGDVRDRDTVARALQGVDIVHHTAARVPLTKAGREYWEINVNGTSIVAEESAKAKVKNFVHMSSSAIFGVPDKLPITENTAARPIEIYGRSKWAGECAVQEISLKNNMPLIIIRPRTILAEGRLGIFQILFERIRKNRNVYVIGNGLNKFQFVHANDLMDAYMLALDCGQPGIYNVGTDRFGTLQDCLGDLITFAKSRSLIKTLPVGLTIQTLALLDLLKLNPLSPWHYLTYHKDYYFDVSKLLALGWKPRYSNDEMFRESYTWYTQNADTMIKDHQSPHRHAIKEKIIALMR